MLDLIIRGGQVVTPDGAGEKDVGIQGEQIAVIAAPGTLDVEAKRVMDASGRIVLPGGIGTLEEAVEMLSWARLGLHAKPMAFLDEDGFWAPFFELMNHIIDGKFTPESFRGSLVHASTPESAIAALCDRIVALDR